MPFLMLKDEGGELVIQNASATSFGTLNPPFSEVEYEHALVFKPKMQPYEWWAWDPDTGGNPPNPQPVGRENIPHFRLGPLIDGTAGDPFQTPPIGVSYKTGLTGQLYRKVTQSFRGEVREVTWYATKTGSELLTDASNPAGTAQYSNPCVIERWTYRRTKTGFLWRSSAEISMIKSNDQEETNVKQWGENVDPVASRIEGIDRRDRHADELDLFIIGNLPFTTWGAGRSASEILSEGISFRAEIDNAFSLYIKNSDAGIVATIGGVTGRSWLDENIPNVTPAVSFRVYLQDQLTPDTNAAVDFDDKLSTAEATDPAARITAIRATDPTNLDSDAECWRALYQWADHLMGFEPDAGVEDEDALRWFATSDSAAKWGAIRANVTFDEAAKDAARDEIKDYYSAGSNAETDRRIARWASVFLNLE